jgi:serine/threonine protein kinase
MLTGKRPFDDESVHKLLDKIIIGEFKFPSNDVKYLTDDAKDLIKCILTPNPKRRYTTE